MKLARIILQLRDYLYKAEGFICLFVFVFFFLFVCFLVLWPSQHYLGYF